MLLEGRSNVIDVANAMVTSVRFIPSLRPFESMRQLR